MGYSLRVQQVLKQRAAERHQRRAAEQAEADAQRADFHATYLDRTRASAALGLSLSGFKRQQMAGRGPRPTKMGSTQQARTFWHIDDVQAYLRDPQAYEAGRSVEPAAGG
jgi:hypothetical protein